MKHSSCASNKLFPSARWVSYCHLYLLDKLTVCNRLLSEVSLFNRNVTHPVLTPMAQIHRNKKQHKENWNPLKHVLWVFLSPTLSIVLTFADYRFLIISFQLRILPLLSSLHRYDYFCSTFCGNGEIHVGIRGVCYEDGVEEDGTYCNCLKTGLQ